MPEKWTFMTTAPGPGSGIANSRNAMLPGISVTAARTMVMRRFSLFWTAR